MTAYNLPFLNGNLAGMNRRTFKGVQALRGIAACMVVVFHATSLWGIDFGDKSRPSYWMNGSAGVDIFFVISGFVMVISASQLKAGEFLKRRIFRIVPLYWIITFLMIAKIAITQFHPSLGSSGPHFEISLRAVLFSLFFIPFRNSLGLVQPILPVGWTLSFEMLFYLIFALALFFKANVVRFIAPIIVALSIIGLFHTDSWPVSTVLIDPLLLEFLAGVVLGAIVQKGIKINQAIAVFLGIVGFIVLIFVPMPTFPGGRSLAWGSAAFAIVMASVMLEDRISFPKWVLMIGDASYSLYLIHILIVLAVARVFIRFASASAPPSEAVLTIVAVAISILASLVTYQFIEKPIIASAKKW